MIIYVFGNPDIAADSLPLKLLPELRKRFPHIRFETKDPNEEWDDAPEELIIIDTAVGIKEVAVFDSLDSFAAAPRVSVHDFDALANLRLLVKLGKIKEIKVIGIPPTIPKKKAFEAVSEALSANA